MALVGGVDSSQISSRLLDRVRYETKLSWSEPGQSRLEFNWGRTLANLFIGTGLMVLVALLGGVAFGAIRLITKWLLPGRIFDRPEDTEIIRLRLGERGN